MYMHVHKHTEQTNVKIYFVKPSSQGQYPRLESVGFRDAQLLVGLPLKVPLLKNVTLGFMLQGGSCGVKPLCALFSQAPFVRKKEIISSPTLRAWKPFAENSVPLFISLCRALPPLSPS